MAARGGDTELMRLLVELGARSAAAQRGRHHAPDGGGRCGHPSPGEDAGTPPEALAAVKLALELGGDANVVDKNGNTVMHGAAYKQLPEVVTLLASKAPMSMSGTGKMSLAGHR